MFAVGTAGAFAGCPEGTGSNGDETPSDSATGDSPGYFSGMYDPSSVLEASTHGFVSTDLGTLYEHRDLLPEETVSQIEQFDQRYEAVSISDIGRMTGQAYTNASVAEFQNTNDSNPPPSGGTVLVEGSFQPDQIVTRLRESASEGTLEEVGTQDGYTLYEAQSDSSLPTTLALSEDSVGMGVTTETASASGQAAVETMIDAQGGDSEYYASSERVRLLVDTLGEGTSVVGVVGNFDPLFEDAEFPNEDTEAILTGISAVGSEATLTDDELTNTLAVVYAEGETPTKETIQSALDWLSDQTQGEDSMPIDLEDISVSVSGRVATASLSRDPEQIIDESRSGGTVAGIELVVLLLLFPVAAPFVFGVGSP